MHKVSKLTEKSIFETEDAEKLSIEEEGKVREKRDGLLLSFKATVKGGYKV